MIVLDYKPNKLEKNQTQVTVGDDRINCPFDCGTPTADVPVINRPEYMKMPLKIMPPEIV